MDLLLLAKAFILGIVEGATEFLPVSSTGHLIIVGDLLNFNDDKGKVFEIVIQLGAILAVLWQYRAKFTHLLLNLGTERASQRLLINLLSTASRAGLLASANIELITRHNACGFS